MFIYMHTQVLGTGNWLCYERYFVKNRYDVLVLPLMGLSEALEFRLQGLKEVSDAP